MSSENKTIQYVALGLQLQLIMIILMNILPESKNQNYRKYILGLQTRDKAAMLGVNTL